MVMIVSQAEAKAAGVGATAAPVAAATAVFSGALSTHDLVVEFQQPAGRLPFPIRPVPAIPIFISLS